MKLTVENVKTIFMKCTAQEKEGAQLIEGAKMKVAFDPSTISDYRGEILSMLSMLPDSFRMGEGGGDSFLNLCADRDGREWTGSHETCDKLVCLGIAINAVGFCVESPNLWNMFPGGVPYIYIK